MSRSRTRYSAVACLMAALLAVLAPNGTRILAQDRSSPATPSLAWASITYLSGGQVYLEVGSRQGVREGTLFDVLRADSVIAQLAAQYVSSNRTACTIVTSTMPLAVGDSVRYRPVSVPATTVADAANPTSLSVAYPATSLRGRAGVRYLVLQQADGTTLSQPAVDLRLDDAHLGGSDFGLAVDIRAQRTTMSGGSTSSPTPSSLTHVYQAAMTFEPRGTRAQWALGRQFATTLSPIGIFDGAALDLNFDRWSAGALAGTQPDAVSFSPSGAITEYGVWVQRHQAPGNHTPWNATLGAIGSYDRGQINREFLYLHGSYSSRHLTLYASEEVDANRGWKLPVEGSSLTATSTFATAQLSLTDALTMSAGVDSRRSVRLYRDFTNPEVVFDDAFRQGTWGEVSLRVSPHLRLSTDARTSTGGTEGGAHAITASLSAYRLTRLQLALRVRTTNYTGPTSGGWLTSVALEAAPANALHLSVNAGQRSSTPPGGLVPTTRLTWTGADLDLALSRSFYLMLSTYHETGSPMASTQSFGGLSWRF